jgi:5-methyltetrahydrofolate--homocysteine methyltransferase
MASSSPATTTATLSAVSASAATSAAVSSSSYDVKVSSSAAAAAKATATGFSAVAPTYGKVETELRQIMKERILILDGAMGTMIQRYSLQEEDFRGERFKNHTKFMKGNNDILQITRPDVIEEIHMKYFEGGADIVETNTFSSNSVSQADYGTEDCVFELNKSAVEIARSAAKKVMDKEKAAGKPYKPRFVAGAIGPTNKCASMSNKVEDSGARSITFDELVTCYKEQVKGLVAGGVDILLVETIFDTLNSKAALYAIEEFYDETNTPRMPLMISATITDLSGRMLTGQTPEAFYVSIAHSKPFCVGLNCALGPKEMRPYLARLAERRSPQRSRWLRLVPQCHVRLPARLRHWRSPQHCRWLLRHHP